MSTTTIPAGMVRIGRVACPEDIPLRLPGCELIDPSAAVMDNDGTTLIFHCVYTKESHCQFRAIVPQSSTDEAECDVYVAGEHSHGLRPAGEENGGLMAETVVEQI